MFGQRISLWVAGPNSRHLREVLQLRLFGTDNKTLRSELGAGMIPLDAINTKSFVSTRAADIDSAKIKHKSGGYSSISVRSYSQGREAAQGAPVDVVVVDEQPDGEWWKEALTRTKATNGHVICSFTPLKDASKSANLLDNMMALPGAEDSPEDMFGPKIRTDGKWSMVRASWHDAPHILEIDPNAIEEAKREYTYDYQSRVYGIPVVGSGRIYPHSFEKIVLNEEGLLINNDWSHLIGVDFGWTDNDPSAMVLTAWDEANDVIYVIDEWKGKTPNDIAFAKEVNYLDPDLPIAWPRDGSKSSDWKGGGTLSLIHI